MMAAGGDRRAGKCDAFEPRAETRRSIVQGDRLVDQHRCVVLAVEDLKVDEMQVHRVRIDRGVIDFPNLGRANARIFRGWLVPGERAVDRLAARVDRRFGDAEHRLDTAKFVGPFEQGDLANAIHAARIAGVEAADHRRIERLIRAREPARDIERHDAIGLTIGESLAFNQIGPERAAERRIAPDIGGNDAAAPGGAEIDDDVVAFAWAHDQRVGLRSCARKPLIGTDHVERDRRAGGVERGVR